MATPRKNPADYLKKGRKLFWTKQRSLNMGNLILDWMDTHPDKLIPQSFFDEPANRKLGYYNDLPALMCERYPSFRRLWERILSLAERRIAEKALLEDGGVNAKFAAFYLERRRNGWAPPKEQLEHSGQVVQQHQGSLTINFVERKDPTKQAEVTGVSKQV